MNFTIAVVAVVEGLLLLQLVLISIISGRCVACHQRGTPGRWGYRVWWTLPPIVALHQWSATFFRRGAALRSLANFLERHGFRSNYGAQQISLQLDGPTQKATTS